MTADENFTKITFLYLVIEYSLKDDHVPGTIKSGKN